MVGWCWRGGVDGSSICFWMSRALPLRTVWGRGGLCSVHPLDCRGSWKLQEGETSLAFSLSSCNTWNNLHRSPFFFLKTLDVYVYVAMTDGGFFSSLCRQFLAEPFFRVSLHCAVNLCRGLSSSQGETLVYYPSIYKHWLDDFTTTYACSMDAYSYI